MTKGLGKKYKFPYKAGDFSWCSIDPLSGSTSVVYTAAYGRGIYYHSKRNGGKWSTGFNFGLSEAFHWEPDMVNPVSATDARGFTYITFRGRFQRGYFVVIDKNDQILDDIGRLDLENNTWAGEKMTNPNIVSSQMIDGAYVAWGTEEVYLRSIGGGGANIPNINKTVSSIINTFLLLPKD